MKIVCGNRVIHIREVQSLTRGQEPEWLQQFIELALSHKSETILGVQIANGKISTNGSIVRMKQTSNSFKYVGALVEWWDIRRCESADDAFALLVMSLPRETLKPSGFA